VIDRDDVKKQIESVISRQKNLSPRVATIVREKLDGLDWDKFVSEVMDDFYAEVGTEGEGMAAEKLNYLVMECIRKKIEAAFLADG
jgi:hypothetical protein